MKSGTFTFKIVETADTANPEEGITYDAGEWTLTVKVKDTDHELQIESWSYVGETVDVDEDGYPVIGEDGEYERTSVEERSDATFNEETLKLVTPVEDTEFGATFTNPYQPAPTTYIPEVTKFVTSLSGHSILKKETFKFTLTAADAKEEGSYWMDEDAQTFIENGDYWDRTIEFAPGEAPGADVAAGIATFDEITYLKSGTYTYTVVEEMGSATGWDYSEDVWTIIVEVVDHDGYLVKQSITYLLNDEEFLKVEATEIEGERVVDAVPAEGEAETEILGLTFTNDYSEGRQLPATGGRGTTIFYVMGSLLVVGAGVVLATRRRKAQ